MKVFRRASENFSDASAVRRSSQDGVAEARPDLEQSIADSPGQWLGGADVQPAEIPQQQLLFHPAEARAELSAGPHGNRAAR
jgi:hypothetical protein